MAPKTKFARNPFCLSKFQPTAEELAKARKLVASFVRRKKDTKIRSMLTFCKCNETEEHKEMLASRGTRRQEYLAKYMTFQMKKGLGRFLTIIFDYRRFTKIRQKRLLGGIFAKHRFSPTTAERKEEPFSSSSRRNLSV